MRAACEQGGSWCWKRVVSVNSRREKKGRIRDAGDGERSIGTVIARWSWTRNRMVAFCLLICCTCMHAAWGSVRASFTFHGLFWCADVLFFSFSSSLCFPPLHICMVVVEDWVMDQWSFFGSAGGAHLGDV